MKFDKKNFQIYLKRISRFYNLKSLELVNSSSKRFFQPSKISPNLLRKRKISAAEYLETNNLVLVKTLLECRYAAMTNK